MRPTYQVIAAMLVFIAGRAEPASPARRGITAEDYFRFETISEAKISPSGGQVAYVVVTVDQKQNRRVSKIWLTSTGGRSAPRQITTGPSSRAIRWSPMEESLTFISTRPAVDGLAQHADKPQVYALQLDGGEPRRLTDLEEGVEAYQWSPDGTRLAVVSRTLPDDFKKGTSDVRHYLSANYKFNDSGWFDDRRSHIFTVDAKTGAVNQITKGATRNDSDPQWSPDGLEILFASVDTAKESFKNEAIWAVSAGDAKSSMISDREAAYRSPRWSPDGKRVVFIGAHDESEPQRIWIAARAGGKQQIAAPQLDQTVFDLEWKDLEALHFSSGVRGETHLFRLALSGGGVQPLTTGARAIHATDLNAGAKTIVYVANDFTHQDDLHAADASGRNERQLTHLNTELWNQLDLPGVERMTYKAADGWDLDGFLVKPVGWREGKKYPMILTIHGGPASMYGVDWYHEFPVYAARGWAVFFVNPRGSTGYGEKFQRGVENEWGGKAYTDIMAGVDAVLAKNPWIDSERLGVTGGSYGGFMANWIVSHTNRFQAAVTLRSISNFISDEGTRDGAYGHERDFGGNLFDKFAPYWDWSPLKYVQNVKTPTLVLHSENDYRVPLEQGEPWFRALRHFGVTSEFVIFPRENHNMTRSGEPKHLVESLNWQIYWFDRFLNGNQAAIRPNEK